MRRRASTLARRRPGVWNRCLLLGLAAAVSAGGCVTAARAGRSDHFPLDPRDELTGPFPSGVEKGWKALLDGDPVRAEAAFEAALSEKSELAAEIGRVEALVIADRSQDALPACDRLLSAGEPTSPLLVACGEARARSGNPAAALTLYRRALARGPGRSGLTERAEELRIAARDDLVASARASAATERWKEARSDVTRALEVAPESGMVHAVAGDIDAASGEKEKALRRYREAMDLGVRDPDMVAKAADLALELGELEMAVSLFDGLARDDARFAPRAEEARLAFRVANWPGPERRAARAQKLTRAAAATLVWWMYPEIREARVANGVIASDAVSRRDSRALTRAVALGLLDVDRETHEAFPDAVLTAPAAARFLLRLLIVVTPANRDVPCLGQLHRAPRAAGEALEAAHRCGLLDSTGGSSVSGSTFTQSLDRVRSLASAGEASDED
jgi:tetratricopeptide (TPR) repeat protein